MIELGCDVGRLTRYLAKRFSKVIAVDISPGNLSICSSMTHEEEGRVQPLLLTSPSDITNVANFDCLVSYIVLQHNPPPIQYFLLNQLFSKLNTGGLVMFQVPTMGVGYQFDIQQYLNSDLGEMDMHVLPISAVMQLLNAHDIVCLDVKHSFQAGPSMLSNTFIGQKK